MEQPKSDAEMIEAVLRAALGPEHLAESKSFLRYYILDGHEPVLVDMPRWAAWFQTHDRRVAYSIVREFHVSTVFLGMDHGHRWPREPEAPPILFETLVWAPIAPPHEPPCQCLHCLSPRRYLDRLCRCSTWEQAEQMHRAAIVFVEGLPPLAEIPEDDWNA